MNWLIFLFTTLNIMSSLLNTIRPFLLKKILKTRKNKFSTFLRKTVFWFLQFGVSGNYQFSAVLPKTIFDIFIGHHLNRYQGFSDEQTGSLILSNLRTKSKALVARSFPVESSSFVICPTYKLIWLLFCFKI